MELADLLMSVIKQFGPMAAVLCFFIYRDKQREERLGKRLDAIAGPIRACHGNNRP